MTFSYFLALVVDDIKVGEDIHAVVVPIQIFQGENDDTNINKEFLHMAMMPFPHLLRDIWSKVRVSSVQRFGSKLE